jgi:hypothetical protein
VEEALEALLQLAASSFASALAISSALALAACVVSRTACSSACCARSPLRCSTVPPPAGAACTQLSTYWYLCTSTPQVNCVYRAVSAEVQRAVPRLLTAALRSQCAAVSICTLVLGQQAVQASVFVLVKRVVKRVTLSTCACGSPSRAVSLPVAPPPRHICYCCRPPGILSALLLLQRSHLPYVSIRQHRSAYVSIREHA